ncbi:MAG: hypothetical protein MMC33_008409 [Icmadophila ericetorum]|nr:hypothetical protein [Icmadophila ericetorum]
MDAKNLDKGLKEQEFRIAKLIFGQDEHYERLQQTMEEQMEQKQNLHQSDEEIKCLQEFRTSKYEEHKARNLDRFPGTCLWFLDDPNFHN